VATERAERVRRALEQLPALEAAKSRQRKKDRPPTEARASTTDPEARVMRLGDGGYLSPAEFERGYRSETITAA
jgi:hypothetical protein